MTRYEASKLADLVVDVPTRLVLGGKPIALVKVEDESVYAVSDVCSHADVSLSEGDVENCTIECWLHGSKFDLRTGAALSLPAIKPVPTYPVTVTDGTVFIDVEDNADAGEEK